MSNGRLCPRRDLVRCPYHGPVVPRDEYGQIQRPPEEGGFIHEDEDEGLNDAEEADLINRAIAAAGMGMGKGKGKEKKVESNVSSQKSASKSTWEDIEDDVHLDLGLEKIEPKRKRGQGEGSSKKKKSQKPPSALINISKAKAQDSTKARLIKFIGNKATKDSVEYDRRAEKSNLSKDARMHQW
jgi:hypothetical protein